MQTIAAWLDSLGLSEYAERFAQNGIEIDVLSELTDQDLKELGVLLGHRRRMLKAIRELDPPTKTAAVTPTSAETSPPQESAERRQLTVIFCDLVGSTALSVRLDPEDLRNLIGAYHKCAAETVNRFDGFVAKYMGDGVLAYFGYPRAHEDDAERSVRAGLALIDAVSQLRNPEPLQVRIGIGTGLVVVGDLIGSGDSQERGVVGETPNLAARLQAVAAPNTIVVGPRTRRLLGDLFEYKDLGQIEVKGFAEPIHAYQVLRASAVESRFEALRSTKTALVGRDEEIELLIRRWQQAKSGDGQVVLISGEPGIGKSRIAQTIAERLSGEPHTRLRYFCSPHHQDSALYPSITQLVRAAGFRREDTTGERLDKLEAVLAQGTDDLSEAMPLLADLLSIPTGDRYRPLNLTPQKHKERTLYAQIAQVEGLAARQPVLIVWEDVHWSDPTTRESLDLVVDRVTTLRVLVILTFRPEFTPPWVGRPHVTLLTLNRLPVRQRAEMIVHVTGGKVLPKEIANQIVDRTDGVPLFIEELTKSVVESGIVMDAGDRYAVAGPGAPLAIPTSLHASLLARLDRLAPTREVAQIGAAIGRSFSHELISAIAAMPERQLDDALEQLVRAELIFRRGTPPDAKYTFKHALVQEAAYATLLRSRRQQIHAQIGRTLEEQFADLVAREPEVLAHHFTQAALTDAAIEWWGKAGEQALRRSAFQEAVSHLGKAIEMADKTGEGRFAAATASASANQRLKLQTDLAKALMFSRGFGAEESKAAFIRARELAAAIDNPIERFTTYYGLWLGYCMRGELRSAREIAETFLREAERGARTTECGFARRLLGSTCLWQGDFIEAQSNLVEALSIYDPERDREARFRFDQDTGAAARVYLANAKWQLGEVGPARALIEEAVAHAIKTGHVPILVNTYFYKAHFEIVRGAAGAARRDAAIVVQRSQENAFAIFTAWGALQSAWASAQLDGRETGATELRQALAAYADQGNKLSVPFFQGLLAEIEAQGDAEGALTRIDEALALAAETGEHYSDAFLHRLRGEILLKGDPANTAQAEDALLTAIAVAQQQKARSFELRAALHLARLYNSTSRSTDARALLASALKGFSPTPEFPEIAEAQMLLTALTS